MADQLAQDWMTRKMEAPYAFIQWKGTDVCADYHCVCGEDFHFDGMFAYAVVCPYCKKTFAVSAMVELKEIQPGEKWQCAGPVYPAKDETNG